ncbi:MAG: winged helix-turn-helix transcriptional regulator [Acidimicrobiales bacterium]
MPDDALEHYPGLEGTEYCPVSIGANLVGDRWSLLIIREMIQGSTRFNEIHRALPGLSRTLLSGRLRTLQRHGLVEHLTDTSAGSYRLTEAGAALRDVLVALGAWTVRWRFPPPAVAVPDSPLLLWRMYQGLNRAKLPPDTVTVEFVFGDAEPSRGWMVLKGDASSLCMDAPPQATDIVIGGTVRVWLAVWFGHRTYGDAVESGDLVVKGPAHLVPQVRHWFDLSPLAGLVAEQRSRGERP